MRTKHFLFTAALVSALAACTNDEFVSNNNSMSDGKGLLVELDPNFTIASTKGDDASTRAYDKDGKFVWLPDEINTADGSATTPATLGLCWTGVNNVNAEYSALTATDYRVFTNYKFEHKGWLYEGQTAPDYDQCAEGAIENGQFIPGSGTQTVATWSGSGTASDGELQAGAGKYSKTTVSGDFANTPLDFSAGFFKSELGTIYQGEYIVYFPYSDEFFNGPVVAVSPKTVELEGLKVAALENGKVQHDANTYAAMSKHGFSVGYTGNMDGGVNAQSFSTKILSGGVVVRLTNSGASAPDKGIKTVTLYSKNKEFILKQSLSASAIKAANNDGSKYGESFYYGEPSETSKTLVAEVKDNTTPTGGALKPAKDNYVDIVIPALPTSVEDLTVLLTNEDNLTAEYKISGTTTIKSVGQGWTLLPNIDVAKLTFDKIYAIDQESFLAATGNASDTNMINVKREDGNKTIRVLGEIELTDLNYDIRIPAGYTIVGEEGDALVLKGAASGKTALFIVSPVEDFSTTTMDAPVLDCDVIVESAGCCLEKGARLEIGNATVGENANITIQGHEEGGLPASSTDGTKDGWLSFDMDSTQATVNGVIVNEGQLTFGKVERKATTKAEVELNGSIQNKKNMVIFYQGTTEDGNDDARLFVSETGNLMNENGAEFTVEGELYFNGKGYNKGVINDRVSSQVTGNVGLFVCDPELEGNEYICDVNDPGKRFNDALTSLYKPTTIVRFVEKPATYDFTNYVGKETGAYKTIKRYIVATGEDENKNKYVYFKGANITLPELVIDEGAYFSLRSNTVWTNLTVTGDLTVNKGAYFVTKGIGVPLPTSASAGDVTAVKTITANNFIVNGRMRLNYEILNVTEKLTINYAEGMTNTITGTVVTINATATRNGQLNIQGIVDLNNNTDIVVYGDIVTGANAQATIVEATGSAGNMPATVVYTGTNTGVTSSNWPKGGPSKMIENI